MNVKIQIGDTPNYATVEIGPLSLYFSYQTCIGFSHPETGTVTHRNVWGPTTGKHLNRIDGGDKDRRLPGDEFEKALGRFNVTVTDSQNRRTGK